MNQEQPLVGDRELRSLLRGIRRGDPMYAVGQSLVSGQCREISDVSALVDALSSLRVTAWRQRIIAAEAIRFIELTPAQRWHAERALLKMTLALHTPGTLRLSARVLRIGLRTVSYWVGASACIWILFGLARYLLNTVSPEAEDAINVILTSTILVLTCVAPFLSYGIEASHDARPRRIAISALGRLGGPTSVGVLATLCADPGREICHAALGSLPRVLRRLTPNDHGKVSSFSIRALCRLIDRSINQGYTYLDGHIALVLESLGKVAGGQAIETVQEVAGRNNCPEWRDIATRILPILLERQRLEQESSLLLRASESPQTFESLLRPAAATAQPVEILLRAAPDDSTT